MFSNENPNSQTHCDQQKQRKKNLNKIKNPLSKFTKSSHRQTQ